jgi:hypothetical protein
MTTAALAALLAREIETMPEAAAAQMHDFAKFIKGKHTQAKPNGIAIKDAYGIFKGIDTHFERDKDDRV